MSRFISLSALLLFPIHAPALEFLCWQVMDFPSMAYEASSTLCSAGKKDLGTVTESNTGEKDKKIVCTAPANCLALTDDVIQILKEKTKLASLDEIKKLSGSVIDGLLAGTPYIGRPSQVVCEGRGTTGPDGRGGTTLISADCPNATACANSEEVLYGLMTQAPVTTVQPFHRAYGTSPMQIMPANGGQR